MANRTFHKRLSLIMNIVFSAYDEILNPFYRGGGALATHQIAKRLAKKYRVTIICGGYPDAKDRMQDNVAYKHIGINGFGPFFGQAFFSLLLPFYVKTLDFDVWVENFVPPHSTNMLQLFTAKPVIGLTSLLNAEEFSRKYRLPFYLLQNVGIKKYKYFIALSRALKNKIRALNKTAKVQIIPRGINKKYLTYKTGEKNYVLFLGRLDVYQKGLDLLLTTWKHLINQNLQLIIAGGGAPKEIMKIKKIIKQEELSNSVKLIGVVTGKNKERLIAECKFAVCPSRFEGFGNSMLEFMAFGKSVICSDIVGFKWLPKNVCLRFSNESVSDLTNKLLKLNSQKTLRRQLGFNAKKFVSSFTWENITDQFEEFINNVMKENSL